MSWKMYFKNNADQTAYVCVPDDVEDQWQFIAEKFPSLWDVPGGDFENPCCTHEIADEDEAKDFALGARIYDGGLWVFGKIKVTAHLGDGYGWLEVKNLSRHTIKIDCADFKNFYSCCQAMDNGESPQGWEDGNGRTVCEWWVPELPHPIEGETAAEIFEEIIKGWGVYAGEPDPSYDNLDCYGEAVEWAFIQEYRSSNVTVKAVHRFPADDEDIPDAEDTKAWKDSLAFLIVSWVDCDGIDYEMAVC